MGPAIRRELKAEFTRLGQPIVSDARSRAGAWSRRIPAAISSRPIVDTTRGRVGVEVRVSRSVPHARPYEGISQQGSTVKFRHPVYADRNKPRSEWTWTEKNSQTRPYLWPAVQAGAPQAYEAARSAFEQAARDAGFR
jgi:hypothetical protein